MFFDRLIFFDGRLFSDLNLVNTSVWSHIQNLKSPTIHATVILKYVLGNLWLELEICGQNSKNIVKPRLTTFLYWSIYIYNISNLGGCNYCIGVNVGGETSWFSWKSLARIISWLYNLCCFSSSNSFKLNSYLLWKKIIIQVWNIISIL